MRCASNCSFLVSQHVQRGSSGLGKAIAQDLLGQGYNLILVAQNATKLEETRRELSAVQRSISAVSELSTEHDITIKPMLSDSDIQTVACDLSHPLSSFHVLRELKSRQLHNQVIKFVIHLKQTTGNLNMLLC
jgi:NAD(P)-dependent dehydrogenase (short-subunit alcohol dehydrogenase family)